MPSFNFRPCPIHLTASILVNSESCALCGTYRGDLDKLDIDRIEEDVDEQIRLLESALRQMKDVKRRTTPTMRKSPAKNKMRVHVDAGFGAVPIDVDEGEVLGDLAYWINRNDF